ncbi:hypothetical protein D3C76_1507920 [compost metagenome]
MRQLRVTVANDALAQTLHGLPGLTLTGIGQNHAKFVATITPCQVARPQVASELVAHLSQHAIADHVAERVIDGLEMVDIDQGNH